MFRALLVCCVVLLTATAGCAGKGDKNPSPGDMETPVEDVPHFTVTITNVTSSTNTTTPIHVEWTVELQAYEDAGTVNNTTALARDLVSTPGRHNANESIEISTQLDWGNATVAEGSLSASAYPNSLPQNDTSITMTSPAHFSANFTQSKVSDVYLRARVTHDGNDTWSSEKKVSVVLSLGPVVTLTYGGGTPPTLVATKPSSDPLNIKVGGGVIWKNSDQLAHTATSDSGSPASFDTTGIASGASSSVIYFTKAGTYTYHCANHANTMKGFQVVVAEAS